MRHTPQRPGPGFIWRSSKIKGFYTADEDAGDSLTERIRWPSTASKSRRGRIADFLAHPAALLILGFTLTGIVGTWVTSYWQTRQHLLLEEYTVIDQLAQAGGDDMAAARDIIDIIFWCWIEDRLHAKIDQRIDYWNKARRTWRAKSIMLRNRVGVYFNDTQALNLLDDVIETVHKLEQNHKHIVERLEDRNRPEFQPHKPRPDELANLAGSSMDLVNAVEAKLSVLTQRLQNDIHPAKRVSTAPAAPVYKLPPPHPCTSLPTATP